MTPSFQFAGAPAEATLSVPRSFLRIAIPSWRFVGIHIESEPEPETVSKEELQSLFRGELSPAARKRVFTDGEERERSVASRIRQALYPQGLSA